MEVIVIEVLGEPRELRFATQQTYKKTACAQRACYYQYSRSILKSVGFYWDEFFEAFIMLTNSQ